MSVDYDACGGIGIELTDEMIEMAVIQALWTEEDFDDDPDGCIDELGLEHQISGSSWSGITTRYLMVRGDTLGEINANVSEFVEKIKQFGVICEPNDLRMILEVHCY